MLAREVDLVLVGADRIAANGDTANKIGTYPLAVLAHAHGIPFYVAAPTSTLDLDLPGRRRDPDRGARSARDHGAARDARRPARGPRAQSGVRRDAGPLHRCDRHRARRRPPAVRQGLGGAARRSRDPVTRILGLETSCDETAAAVVEDRHRVLSSIVASQVAVHRRFGGVVPEIAARHHVEAIDWVVRQALDEAGTGLDAIDAIAVTQGPGLIGSLLVGVCAGKAMAWHRGLPLLAVHHLEGHVRSVFLEHPAIAFPAIALVVSGGHTTLFVCPAEGQYHSIARTRDDAAGEAFDKVAKLLGLGYPGGPAIERIAQDADDRAYDFPQAQMKDHSIDFSFSGLKSAVRRAALRDGLVAPPGESAEVPGATRDLAASFQRAVVGVLVERSLAACRREGIRTLLVTGGVACNERLRREFREAAAAAGIELYLPSPRYTTDNAAMIAAAGFLHFERGQFAPPDVTACAELRLG